MGKKTTEIRLLLPRRVPLGAEQERDAVAVLSELLLDVAHQRQASASGSALDGGSGGALCGVVSLPASAGKARKAA